MPKPGPLPYALDNDADALVRPQVGKEPASGALPLPLLSVQGVFLLPRVSLSRPWLLLVPCPAAALARPSCSGLQSALLWPCCRSAW